MQVVVLDGRQAAVRELTRQLPAPPLQDLSAKPFFKDLVDYIVSGPVICMVRGAFPALQLWFHSVHATSVTCCSLSSDQTNRARRRRCGRVSAP